MYSSDAIPLETWRERRVRLEAAVGHAVSGGVTPWYIVGVMSHYVTTGLTTEEFDDLVRVIERSGVRPGE